MSGHAVPVPHTWLATLWSLEQIGCHDAALVDGLQTHVRACCPGAPHVAGHAVAPAVSQQSGLLFSGRADTFVLRFICNDDVYPGMPRFLHQDIDSRLGIRDTYFEFETALACVPSPVDCQVTGETGRKCVCVHARMCFILQAAWHFCYMCPLNDA